MTDTIHGPEGPEPATVTRASRVPWITTAAIALVAALGLIFPLSAPATTSATSFP